MQVLPFLDASKSGHCALVLLKRSSHLGISEGLASKSNQEQSNQEPLHIRITTLQKSSEFLLRFSLPRVS